MEGGFYDNELEKSLYGYRVCGFCFLGIVLFLLFALVFSGCTTTKYVPVETVKRDTVYQSKLERDSVYLHDSIYVKEWQNGDTVFRDRDRWHTKYIDREVCDTLYQSRVDSIAVPYYVEKSLSWWQRKKIEFGELAMVVIAGLLLFLLIKFKFKFL